MIDCFNYLTYSMNLKLKIYNQLKKLKCQIS